MKKFISILIVCVISLPVFAVDENIMTLESNEAQMQTTVPEEPQKESITSQENILSQENVLSDSDVKTSSTFKQPNSKKKLAKRFIIGMLSVLVCSVFLYITLSIYNKFRELVAFSESENKVEENSLETPTDLTEAVKTFIEKTKW